MEINVSILGRVDYTEALTIQERLLESRRTGQVRDTLLLLEHPPVITIGRRGSYENILAAREQLDAEGVGVYEVNRGGDVTYHGPGQVVGYPVMDLCCQGRDIKDFVLRLEEVFIRLLAENYGIAARREDRKYTGVWVGDEKITAIGIAVKRWVTMHGFAFNVNTQLDHFKWIVPCGIADRGVTSLQKILGRTLDISVIFKQVAEYFCEVFDMQPVFMEKSELYKFLQV